MKTTEYFQSTRNRPDRQVIEDKWIQQAVLFPEAESVQSDGRLRRWVRIEAAENRYLRVILLPDGETVHNAFFDRRYKP